MPSNEAKFEPMYSIWVAGEVREGSARDLLEEIRSKAGSEEIRRMNREGYAKILISDAPFFLPKDLFEYLRAQPYESEYDRALRYLSEMPTSGVRILSKRQTG